MNGNGQFDNSPLCRMSVKKYSTPSAEKSLDGIHLHLGLKSAEDFYEGLDELLDLICEQMVREYERGSKAG